MRRKCASVMTLEVSYSEATYAEAVIRLQMKGVKKCRELWNGGLSDAPTRGALINPLSHNMSLLARIE